MPPAIIGAAIALGASAAAAASIIAAGTALAIGMAAMTVGMLLTKTPGNFGSYVPVQERKQVLRSATASRLVVYGEIVGSGVMTFAEEQAGNQEKGEWLHMVITIAGHEIERISDLQLGDDPDGEYGNLVTWKLHNNPTTPDPFLIENCPSWKPDMIGKGLAWLRISFKFDAEKFPSGLPNIKMRKRGRKIYDPRKSQTLYSNNAALVILDYFRTYLKRSDDMINWDQFKAAANLCDEIVTNADKTTERRYTINGEFDLEEASSKILDAMLEACGGELTYIGGKHGLLVGAYYGPATLTIDESCIAGDIKIVPETSYKERTNTITGKFVDPAQNFVEADFPAVSVAEWVEKDGREIPQDINYRFVTSSYQAQRLANITLRRKRIGRSMEIPMNMKGYKVRPGMYVKVKIAQLGMNNVEMRCVKWSFDPKTGVQVTLRQETRAVWADAIGQPMERPDLVDLPTGGVAQPYNLAYQVMEISDVVQGVLSWTNTGNVAYNRVAIRQNGSTVWTAQVPSNSVRLSGLLRGAYTAHVIAVGYSGATSPEGYLQFNIQAPPAPTSVEVKNGYFAITLIPKINQVANVSTQFDFWTSGTTKLASTNTDVVERQATRAGMGTVWTSEGLLNDRTYYWYVRTVNAFGSSAFVEVAALCLTATGDLMDMIDADFKTTDTYKELSGDIKEVADGVTSLTNTVNTNDKKYIEKIDSVQQSVVTIDGVVQSQGTTINSQGQVINSQGQVIDTLGKEVVAVKGTVQETSKVVVDLNKKLSAQWGMKVQIDANGQKYVAGMQLGVEGQGGALQSYAMFSANNFAIYNPNNGTSQLAFAARGGQVFIQEAFIANGSIDNAKIGSFISSSNYAWNGGNFVGWYIGKDGTCLFNNGTFKGTVYASAGSFTGDVYANNGWFKGTVYAEKIEGDVSTTTSVALGSTSTETGIHTVRYAGGMPFIVRLIIPFINLRGYTSSTSAPMRFRVLINGTPILGLGSDASGWFAATLTSSTQTVVDRFVSGYVDIPAYAVNVPIQIQWEKYTGGSYNGNLTWSPFTIIASPMKNNRFS